MFLLRRPAEGRTSVERIGICFCKLSRLERLHLGDNSSFLRQFVEIVSRVSGP
jgi:hypothetical protein